MTIESDKLRLNHLGIENDLRTHIICHNVPGGCRNDRQQKIENNSMELPSIFIHGKN